jgi:hypothetical protein
MGRYALECLVDGLLKVDAGAAAIAVLDAELVLVLGPVGGELEHTGTGGRATGAGSGSAGGDAYKRLLAQPVRNMPAMRVDTPVVDDMVRGCWMCGICDEQELDGWTIERYGADDDCAWCAFSIGRFGQAHGRTGWRWVARAFIHHPGTTLGGTNGLVRSPPIRIILPSHSTTSMQQRDQFGFEFSLQGDTIADTVNTGTSGCETSLSR